MFSFFLSLCLALTGFSMTGMSDLVYSDGHSHNSNLAINSLVSDFELPEYSVALEEETIADEQLLAYHEEDILALDEERPAPVRHRPVRRVRKIDHHASSVERTEPVGCGPQRKIVRREPIRRPIKREVVRREVEPVGCGPRRVIRKPAPVVRSCKPAPVVRSCKPAPVVRKRPAPVVRSCQPAPVVRSCRPTAEGRTVCKPMKIYATCKRTDWM